MSVLVFAESQKGQFKKSTLEAVTYGKKVAGIAGGDCIALTLGEVQDAGQLGLYGADKVYNIPGDSLSQFDSQAFTAAIAQAAEQLDAKVLVLSHTSAGKALAGRLAVRLKAGSVTGVNSLPSSNGSFRIKKNVFSGKAIAEYEIKTDVKVITLTNKSLPPEQLGSTQPVETLDISVAPSRTTVKEVKTMEGGVPLPEADLVVSAGRGMKGPENWGIIEELAEAIGASTACSRPVSDTGWRPHHEHVGQTGITIRPNLYIAVGISGAIQHLAGVNRSKVIVVINKDPEAPFFKSADYGVVGDLFDVVPRLTKAVRELKDNA